MNKRNHLDGATFRRLLLLPLAMLLVVGCKSESSGLAVTGSVTLGSDPLPVGTIFLHPLQAGKGVVADIVEGRFEIAASEGLQIGEYRVEIYSEKATGRQIPNPDAPDQMMEETKQIIPRRYNTESELTAKITDNTSELDYEL
ncbi:hypothetical protein [Aeoliella mucimassa]|uniref:Carboxypeptidase regulatory-like domain-containing protein n=1 Tax=Aeoliella mucimassa TaxID=2527972 RepID=A0A518APM3_9BACT|nr:hypothetical protein [Aeoliella mucimassa]QDU56675.1 hypothetical protein Pan181_28850 [Aeoliella mucimassa]